MGTHRGSSLCNRHQTWPRPRLRMFAAWGLSLTFGDYQVAMVSDLLSDLWRHANFSKLWLASAVSRVGSEVT